MKRIVTLLLFLMVATTGVSAQQGAGHGSGRGAGVDRDEIQSMKIAFMTEYLALTPAESEKFWPIYNKYWTERTKIAHQRRTLFTKIEKGDATQADIDSVVKLSKDETELISRLAAEISRAISVPKAAKTLAAEEKFKSNLLRRTHNSASGR